MDHPPPSSTNPTAGTDQGQKRRSSSLPSPPPPEDQGHGHHDHAAAIPGATVAATALAFTSLRKDIDPHGPRVFLPFLNDEDHLGLSGCCQALRPYLYHLPIVKLRCPPSPSPTDTRPLVGMLLRQDKDHCFECLKLRDRSVLHVLGLACWGRLKTLDLSDMGLQVEDLRYVEQAISTRDLINLEALLMSFGEAQGLELRMVLQALGQGVCPRLQRLSLVNPMNDFDEVVGDGIAAALESGRLNKLQDLQLRYRHLRNGGVVAIARALGRGACSQLVKLDISSGKAMSAAEGQALAESMTAGGCTNLEELILSSDEEVQALGLRSVMEALGHGACPHLRRICLVLHAMTGIDETIGDALESDHLNHLQDLRLHYIDLSGGGMTAIARALEGGACPQLVRLDVCEGGLIATDGQALAKAMRAGGCNMLEELRLNKNSIGDVGFVAMFGAMEVGGCPQLKRLVLCGDAMSPPAATALGHALVSDNCQNIQVLGLQSAFSGPGAADYVLYAIQQKGPGAMPNLLHLDLSNNRLGAEDGQALGAAIGVKAFPKLKVLHLSFTKALGEAGVVAIMGGLEGGGCPHLGVLSMDDVYMGPQGGRALGRALASGNLKRLETVKLTANGGIGDDAMERIVLGLKQCHDFRELHVRGTRMGRKAGEVLVQALREDAWPRLTELDASVNSDLLRDEVVGSGLVEVIETEGRFQHLRMLNLNTTGVRKDVLLGVLRALHENARCPRLRQVSVDWGLIYEQRGTWMCRLKERGVRLSLVKVGADLGFLG